MEEIPQPFPPLILSPCSSGRRSSSSSTITNSPEFEFWMLRNPSTLPDPNLLTADELFSDGVLLPLQHLRLSNPPPPSDQPETTSAVDELPPHNLSSTTSALTSSKRWTDIFKKTEKKSSEDQIINCVKEKKKREKKKTNGASNGVSNAELNINIWPFSRSRSAGNNGTRPKSTAAIGRKVSSAPCSRSNSAGDSKSRKWPGSPSRGAGVHLGTRNSPVWNLRREKSVKRDGRRLPAVGSKVKVLSLNVNVPMCIGYREHLSCRGFEDNAVSTVNGGQNGVGEGVRGNNNSNFFNIRSLFTKKVY